MTNANMHECGTNHCKALVPRSQLLCSYHWRLVPADLKERVYSAYRGNDLVAHAEACHDARMAAAGAERVRAGAS